MPIRIGVARIALWIAVVVAVVMATLPHPPELPIDTLGDKFEHSLAFTVLAVFSVLAYPLSPLPRISERLSFLGAMIEVVQSIPALHRDCDIMDWVTDTIAIVVALMLVALVRKWRARKPALA
jgi:VanZ family protein